MLQMLHLNNVKIYWYTMLSPFSHLQEDSVLSQKYHSISSIMFPLQIGTSQSEAPLSLRAKNSSMISLQCYSLELLTRSGGLWTEQSSDL